MTHRYRECFAALSRSGRGAFIPFTVLGFPDPRRCVGHLELLAAQADALELGVPFSDPVADGPTLQRAGGEALAAGTTVRIGLDLCAGLRQRHPDLPIGLLVYANLVVHRGVDAFYSAAAEAGVDSILVADVPSEEGEPFAAAAHRAGISPVFIAPPNAPDAALERIARLGDGYTYVLTRSGVTGAERVAGRPTREWFEALARRRTAPPVLGFGISNPEQVAEGIAAGAAGVISGSAVVARLRRLEEGEFSTSAMQNWLRSMRDATIPAGGGGGAG